MPIPNTINPDLIKERAAASFDVDEFAAWFYGSKELLQMKRLIEPEIYTNLDDPHELQYLSYEDKCITAVKNATEVTTKLRKIQQRLHAEGNEIYPTFMGGPFGEALLPVGNPLAVHTLMFTRILKNQLPPELYEKYGKRAENCEILGTYAQTELGHGTNLKGLETRADYDRARQEFVLNTPTLTAYKWWPGGLGQTVNYCIVAAQLYINKEPKGMQLFFLQVRDEQTHEPLPGIELGDIGHKIGFTGVNNGYMGLKNVRIPREHMLMKNAKVLADGTFIKSPAATLNYLPMVFVRCQVAIMNAFLLAQSVTIATRYSAVRRQSPINANEAEPQILDHKTQQLKIFPEIATAIAYRFAAAQLIALYESTQKAVAASDYSRLQELHALACTLKASSSYDATFGIERLRLSCGGHGYLSAGNFGNIFATTTASCTYEGENSVLYLQVGKILLKNWTDHLKGLQLMPTMAYISECAALKQFPKWSGDWACLVKALQYTATNKTRIAFQHYNDRLQQDQTPAEAANNTGIELTQAAELHGRAFVTLTLLQETTGPKSIKRSAALNKVIGNLLELYLVQTVLRHMADILRFIKLTESDLSALQERLELVLQQIRPDAVAICDGFDFRDCMLSSVLGCYDGNVYERIFESAQKSPLNKTIVPKSFELYLKPFMKSNL